MLCVVSGGLVGAAHQPALTSIGFLERCAPVSVGVGGCGMVGCRVLQALEAARVLFFQKTYSCKTNPPPTTHKTGGFTTTGREPIWDLPTLPKIRTD